MATRILTTGASIDATEDVATIESAIADANPSITVTLNDGADPANDIVLYKSHIIGLLAI